MAGAQGRPTGGGTSAGTAAPRGGDTGTSTSSGSGNSGSSGGAVSRGGGSMGSGSMGGGSISSPANVATGRYDGPRSGESLGTARSRGGSVSAGQPVPGSERPRGDTPTIGLAGQRTSRPPTGGTVVIGGYPFGDYGNYGYYGYPYYGSWYPGYGYFGSMYGYPWYYDPYSWWAGLGPLYGWGMYALPMSAYSSMWSDYYAGSSPSYIEPITGSIKLKVKPRDAEVYVDDTYYGKVDHYDGAFQHLDLKAGTHKVEIRANGYETIQFQIRVLPGKTTTYNGEMKAVK
jgi:hypothetical protein